MHYIKVHMQDQITDRVNEIMNSPLQSGGLEEKVPNTLYLLLVPIVLLALGLF